MQRILLALLIASSPLSLSAPAAAQRSADGPREDSSPITVTQFHHRHERDFDRYRGARRSHAPVRVWVPGHFETQRREVVVRGGTERRWMPARFETRYDSCGRRLQIQISTGHWEVVRLPDRVETRLEKVWIPAHWETR